MGGFAAGNLLVDSSPMKAVVQRCRSARVEVHGRIIGEIEAGLVVFLGVADGDTPAQAEKLAAKVAALRIFSDEAGRFNYSVKDVGGRVLVISNFTICGDSRKGNRPNFVGAAAAELARELYESFATLLERHSVGTARGEFGEDMRVFVENDGPVTILLEA